MTTAGWSEATLADVARVAGVSPTTASRALHGPVERVSDRLRVRVEDAATRLGYSADRHAQLTARREPSALTLILDVLADPFVTEAARGVVERADERGHAPLLRVLPQTEPRRVALLRDVRGERPRGVIVILSEIGLSGLVRRHLAAALAHGAAVTVLDRGQTAVDARELGRLSVDTVLGTPEEEW